MENLSNMGNSVRNGTVSELLGGNKPRIHFIGIGGSGMYPLAQILHQKGFTLSGSDNNPTDTVEAVKKLGITVYMGHFAENITDSKAEVIVRSAAIPDDNPEIIAARSRNIPIIERAELLGYVTGQYSKAVCVSGTHGKTTVSSMLTYIFMSAENESVSDISAVIGGKLGILGGGSGRTGAGDIMVCEACEYADTFLRLKPNISVILNINRDHLEYFKTMENLRLSFTKFCDLTSDVLVVNGEDDNTALAVNDSGFTGRLLTFGRSGRNDYYPKNISAANAENASSFDLYRNGKFIAHINLNIPGEHNILNAVAACGAALEAGADADSLVKGLDAFTGAGRRFETLYKSDGITVVDDYAHHPTEITATLKAARAMNPERLWAVHQPFTYSRTKALLGEFADALSLADKVTLTEIMGGREIDNRDVHATDLAEKIENCDYFKTFDETADFIVENARRGDFIITLGCGDVNKLSHKISKKFSEKDTTP